VINHLTAPTYIHTNRKSFRRRFHIILYVNPRERTTPQLTSSLWHSYSIVARWLHAFYLAALPRSCCSIPRHKLQKRRSLERGNILLSTLVQRMLSWLMDWPADSIINSLWDADFYSNFSVGRNVISSRAAIHQSPSVRLEIWMRALMRRDVDMDFLVKSMEILPLDYVQLEEWILI